LQNQEKWLVLVLESLVALQTKFTVWKLTK